MKRKMRQRVIQQRRQQRNIQAMLSKPHCPHGYDMACLICGFGTVNGERVWHNKTEPKKGDRVKVDFIGESATIYSGKRFTGYGVLDRVEDGRVFGRLEDGMPFMCLCVDVEVVEG